VIAGDRGGDHGRLSASSRRRRMPSWAIRVQSRKHRDGWSSARQIGSETSTWPSILQNGGSASKVIPTRPLGRGSTVPQPNCACMLAQSRVWALAG